MATTAHITASAQPTFSALVLCDSLLSLAEDAGHAGLRATAKRLLDLATSVLGPRAARTDAVPPVRNRDINPKICKLEDADGNGTAPALMQANVLLKC